MGIGTIAPVSLLHVQNQPGIVSNTFVSGISNCGNPCGQGVSRNIVLFNDNTTGTNFGSIDFVPGNNSNNLSGASIQGIDRDATSNFSGLSFFTRNASNYASRLTIKSSGKIGIGTETPSTTLHIQGTNPSFRLEDGTQGADKILTSDANGNARWATSASVFSNINIYNSDGSLTGNRMVTQGANTLAFKGNSVNAFSVDGSTFSVDAANHNVGIGTINPKNYLHITEPGKTSGIPTSYVIGQTITGSGGTGPGFYLENLTNATNNKVLKLNLISNSNNEGFLNFESVSDDATASVKQIMSLTTNGKVGIGTQTPQRVLEVSANNNPIRVTNLQNLNGGGGNTNILSIDGSGDVRRVPLNNLLAGPVSLTLVTSNYSLSGNESVVWNGAGTINVTLPTPTDDQVGKSVSLVAAGGIINLLGSTPTVVNSTKQTSIPAGKRMTIFAIAKNVWGNTANEWVVIAKDF